MRQRLALMSTLVAGVLLGLCIEFNRQPEVALAGPPGTLPGSASTNGDINCDGSVNIADAISLLGFLFSAQPAPCQFAPAALPTTGQTVCYDVGSVIEDCALVQGGAPLQDGCVQAGCPTAGRFSVISNPNGTSEAVVQDSCTGLMWMQVSADTASPVGQIDAADAATWLEALGWCENSTYGGFNDWRLPNAFELFTLQNLEEFDRRYAEFDFSGIGTNYWYWSSTTSTFTNGTSSGHAWMCCFGNDWPAVNPRTLMSYPKADLRFVRAVRGGVINGSCPP